MSEVQAHIPVLLDPALRALDLSTDAIVMDVTYGRGSHSAAILSQLGPSGRLIVMDRDPEAIEHAHRLLGDDQRVTICHGSFEGLAESARQHGVFGRVSGLLADLGVSSPQIDQPGRGFSFREDGPLDMRMDPTRGESAQDWLARAEENELARV